MCGRSHWIRPPSYPTILSVLWFLGTMLRHRDVDLSTNTICIQIGSCRGRPNRHAYQDKSLLLSFSKSPEFTGNCRDTYATIEDYAIHVQVESLSSPFIGCISFSVSMRCLFPATYLSKAHRTSSGCSGTNHAMLVYSRGLS